MPPRRLHGSLGVFGCVTCSDVRTAFAAVDVVLLPRLRNEAFFASSSGDDGEHVGVCSAKTLSLIDV